MSNYTPTVRREEVDEVLARMREMGPNEMRWWVGHGIVVERKFTERITVLEKTLTKRDRQLHDMTEERNRFENEVCRLEDEVERLTLLLTPKRTVPDVEGSVDLAGSEERVERYEKECARTGRDVV